jgi:hypothetical protein
LRVFLDNNFMMSVFVRYKRQAWFGALLFASLLGACKHQDDNSALESNVATVAVKLDAVKLMVGFTTQANVTLKDVAGNPALPSGLGWYSSNPKVANVDPASGVVTALGPGVTNIVAMIGGHSGASRLVVGATEKAAVALADSVSHADTVDAKQAQGAPADAKSAEAAAPTTVSPSAVAALAAAMSQRAQQQSERIAHDFNDGTFGPFDNSTPGHNSIVDDPTNSGHGKVLQIKYDGVGKNADLNQYAAWLPKSGLSHGSTFFFRGEIYYPASTPRITDTGVLRKIIYFRTDRPGNKQCDLVLFQWGSQIGIDVETPNTTQLTKYNIFSLNIGAWNTVQLQVTTNSQPGLSDGTLRVWDNGALVYENLHIAFTSAADPASTRWSWLTFGHQREGATGDGAINEVRYWDNIVFTTGVAP